MSENRDIVDALKEQVVLLSKSLTASRENNALLKESNELQSKLLAATLENSALLQQSNDLLAKSTDPGLKRKASELSDLSDRSDNTELSGLSDAPTVLSQPVLPEEVTNGVFPLLSTAWKLIGGLQCYRLNVIKEDGKPLGIPSLYAECEKRLAGKSQKVIETTDSAGYKKKKMTTLCSVYFVATRPRVCPIGGVKCAKGCKENAQVYVRRKDFRWEMQCANPGCKDNNGCYSLFLD